jgi:hypothetical protein
MGVRYQVVRVTDLRTRAESFKVYERPVGAGPPVATGIKTREEAEAKALELDAATEAKP